MINESEEAESAILSDLILIWVNEFNEVLDLLEPSLIPKSKFLGAKEFHQCVERVIFFTNSNER
jgi:hypothetical protein